MDGPEIDGRTKVNPRWYASTLAAVYVFFWVFRFLYVEWCAILPFNDTAAWLAGARWTNATLAGIAVLVLLLLRSNRIERLKSRKRQAILLFVLMVFFSFHLDRWYMHQKQPWLFIEDVGRTTIAADRLVVRGLNPYAAHIDDTAEHLAPQAHLDGYKYLPVMMAAYMPFARLCRDGDWAILTANLLFSVIGAGALAACVKKWISTDAAILCAILFFIPEIISQEQLSNGCNDMVPMILLFLAIYHLERRFSCGLLVGLAICAKILPGALWIAVCLTPRWRARYFAGVLAGLALCLPFLAWNPAAFLGNVVMYNFIRPVEITSTLYQMPWIAGVIAKVIVPSIFVWMFWRAWRAEIPPIHRAAWATTLAIGVLLTGPMNHPNYFLWWFMPFCGVLTAALMNPACYEWMGSGPRIRETNCDP